MKLHSNVDLNRTTTTKNTCPRTRCDHDHPGLDWIGTWFSCTFRPGSWSSMPALHASTALCMHARSPPSTSSPPQSDPTMIKDIIDTVSLPVMAKVRIGHFVEAQILQAIGVDYIDESEVLTMADDKVRVVVTASSSNLFSTDPDRWCMFCFFFLLLHLRSSSRLSTTSTRPPSTPPSSAEPRTSERRSDESEKVPLSSDARVRPGVETSSSEQAVVVSDKRKGVEKGRRADQGV
jgi:hypothetical protein